MHFQDFSFQSEKNVTVEKAKCKLTILPQHWNSKNYFIQKMTLYEKLLEKALLKKR